MTSSVLCDSETSVAAPAKRFTVGTLSYTKQGLWMLFFWLMWNDFTITLLEQVLRLNNLSMQKRGASYTLIAMFGSAAGFMGMWINPFFSTWSDRLRSSWGRRRPFLIVSVPLFALSMMAIPFMPDLFHRLVRVEYLKPLLARIPGNGEVWFIGTACFINQLFNMVVLAIFSYYYWDVVPESVLGRFQSMAKVITMSASLVWNFWIFGRAEVHPKEVYVGVAVFCLVIYLLSVWRVKEGEYPPPEPHKKGIIQPVYLYFKECFSEPYYLWIFLGTLMYQSSNAGGGYVTYYFVNDLHMSYNELGWVTGISQGVAFVFGISLGFAVGSMLDRLKPIRVLPALLFIRAIIAAVAFFVVHDKTTAIVFNGINEVVVFCYAVGLGAVTVELFPREKLGQFCSAQAFFYQTILTFVSPFMIAPFFDWLKCNRAGFMFSAVCLALAGLVAIKVYFNWKQRQEEHRLVIGPA